MGLFGGADLPDLPDIDAQLNLFSSLMERFGVEAEARRGIMAERETAFLDSINKLVEQLAPEAAAQFDFGTEMRDLYRTIALPAEKRFHAALSGYDTPARRALAFGRGAGAVTTAAGAQEMAQVNALRAAGINPNDPRYAAERARAGAMTAAAAAAQGRREVDRVEETGVARNTLATEIGRGWQRMGEGATRAGAALGVIGPNALQSAYTTTAQIGGTPRSWYGDQLAVANNYIDQMMQRYQAKMGRAAARSQAQGLLGGALGTIAGAGLGLFMGGGFGGGLDALRAATLGAQIGGSAGGSVA